MDTHPKISFLGLPLAAISTARFMETLLAAARERAKPFTVGYLNAATVNLAFESADFAANLRRLNLLYADGQAVVWAVRWLGAPIPERVNAGDFTREVVSALAAQRLKLALVGGRPGEAERASEVFKSWAPGLNVVYVHHGFFEEAETGAVKEALEYADPDLVLLGMGSPRQERLAVAWAGGTQAPPEGGTPNHKPRAWWCVGALFEYYAGTRRRAPVWMRRAGLEWAFRLALEPVRLWKRYLIGNPLFIGRVFRRKAI